jgi:endonuclease G
MTNDTRRQIFYFGRRILFGIISIAVAGAYKFGRFSHEPSPHRHEGSSHSASAPSATGPTQSGEATVGYWPGEPTYPSSLTVIHRIGYTTAYDATTHTPRWVTYDIKSVSNPVSAKRPETFFPDPTIPSSDRVETREFSRTGFDRGHMAPNWAVSISYGREAQEQSFFLTNVSPQSPELNRGIWEELEKIEANDYARRYNGVATCDGPIFTEADTKGIGLNNRIRVPSSFFKIIVRRYNGNADVLAFIFPQYGNGKGRAEMERHLTTVQEIEKETGVHFLTNFTREERLRVDVSPARRMW